jgi:hypothetical protein
MGQATHTILMLCSGAIEPIGFRVPRKDAGFADDLFPPTVSDEPSLTVTKYLSGANAEPIRSDVRVPPRIRHAPTAASAPTAVAAQPAAASNPPPAVVHQSAPAVAAVPTAEAAATEPADDVPARPLSTRMPSASIVREAKFRHNKGEYGFKSSFFEQLQLVNNRSMHSGAPRSPAGPTDRGA